MINKDLKRRIIEISYRYRLSHLGSCLTAVDIIDKIYKTKKADEPFILSSGHAGLALYVVLEKYQGIDAEYLFKKHGVHPNRDIENGIYCSTGSLGQGLPIAVGMALADRSKDVYCLISDGECSEGSIWEAVRIIKQYNIENLKLHINNNGWAAYQSTRQYLIPGSSVVWNTGENDPIYNDLPPFLKGVDAHYHMMTEDEYREALEILK